MIRKLLIPLAATALLAGCVTTAPYGYRGGGQGDYYYGSPSVDYRYRLSYSKVENADSVAAIEHPVVRSVLQHYGFDEPTDFATTSWRPSVSNTARMGPPAITPVPAGAARR